MTRIAIIVLLTVACCALAGATTYTVTTAVDSGVGTLRWAIDQANARVGGDRITFAAGLSGATISPTTELPTLVDSTTTIDGDLNDDDAPDVTLDGASAPEHSDGLRVEGDGAVIIGLCIGNFDGKAIYVEADSCRIRCCHIGVDRAGTTEQPNTFGIYLLGDSNRIGGASAAARNVFAGSYFAALTLQGGSDNLVVGNYFGITRDGSAVLRASPTVRRWGISDLMGTRSVIGGTTPEARNVFAGLDYGVAATTADEGSVQGNYFGLAANGSTSLEIGCGVAICDSTDCTVGGTEPGARNVFAGGADPGVLISIWNVIGTPECSGTKVVGNYFGLNAAGTERRRLKTGVRVETDNASAAPGAQTIGGPTRAAANWFCPNQAGSEPRGIVFNRAGEGSLVRNNVFGVLPQPGSGVKIANMTSAVRVDGVQVRILDNDIRRANTGVHLGGAGARANVYRNTFRNLKVGLAAYMDSRAFMGNLGNTQTSDDGGNEFVSITDYFIRNHTAYPLKAEGNDFGTTSEAAIDAKIYDRLDWASYGRVDFDPLIGGLHPTGEGGAVVLAGAVAVPAGTGAEIAFSLSTPAAVTVEVLNLAGRLVATVARERTVEAGTNRIVWSGLTARGTRAPAGSYLVRVTARGQEGGEARALCRVRLDR
jgi:hypothetical protein